MMNSIFDTTSYTSIRAALESLAEGHAVEEFLEDEVAQEMLDMETAENIARPGEWVFAGTAVSIIQRTAFIVSILDATSVEQRDALWSAMLDMLYRQWADGDLTED